MKLCRDELLLLGGIYQVAALIVSLFTSDIAYAVNGVLYILFWIAVLAIAFNWVPGFVFQLNDRFPRISVFLASIGCGRFYGFGFGQRYRVLKQLYAGV